MTEHVNVEGQSWTVGVHAGWTERQFVDLYTNEGHGHIYDWMKPEAKKAALSLAWKQIQAELPKPEPKIKKSEPEEPKP